MKKIILLILLAISVSGMASAQPPAFARFTQLSKTLTQRARNITQARSFRAQWEIRIRTRAGAVSGAATTTGRSTAEAVLGNLRTSPYPPTERGILSNSPLTPEMREFMQRSAQLEEMNVRFQSEGFVPIEHNVVPIETILDNDNLLHEVQRQETLSNKHDRLREKIYKALNKLNSTEWESTITGYTIYNNEYEYEYIWNAA